MGLITLLLDIELSMNHKSRVSSPIYIATIGLQAYVLGGTADDITTVID